MLKNIFPVPSKERVLSLDLRKARDETGCWEAKTTNVGSSGPAMGASHIKETGKRQDIRAQRDLQGGLCLKVSNLLLPSKGCSGAAGLVAMELFSPLFSFQPERRISALFQVGFLRTVPLSHEMCRTWPCSASSAHWRRKGSLHEQTTPARRSRASLGHKRDFSLTPQKETNGTRKNSFPARCFLSQSQWPEGPDGCLSTGWPRLITAQDRTRLLQLFIISAKEGLTGEKKKKKNTSSYICI